ncbi:hypothetical protein MKW94_004139 [Papaver nudicaule]|uniref:UBP-type domain-containing protein n=1 Tax=Papaver nudicaule TaxID=74823 RepID=A0AA41VTF3_PAPNU|nr:hypothetical protein [Papaver nudicaule]MCL7046969.1 hypothetical protein [Papaver nudicaule]
MGNLCHTKYLADKSTLPALPGPPATTSPMSKGLVKVAPFIAGICFFYHRKWTDNLDRSTWKLSCAPKFPHLMFYIQEISLHQKLVQHQQPEKSKCSICETLENLWICVICGFVGCGRYKEGHAITHWKETQHCYSLELETRRVWDYVGDNYVHRLIQSKTDGKLVELNTCMHTGDYGSCECSKDFGTSEVLFSSKLEAVVNEYKDLLASQLENQRTYFESLLLEAKEETEKEISESIDKALGLKLLKSQSKLDKQDKHMEEKKFPDEVNVNLMKLQKLQSKLDKHMEEKKFLDEVNVNLMKNQDFWKSKILEIEERERKALKKRDEKIEKLEEQLRGLMVYIEAENTEEQVSTSSEIKDSMVMPISVEAANTNTKNASRSSNRKRH